MPFFRAGTCWQRTLMTSGFIGFSCPLSAQRFSCLSACENGEEKPFHKSRAPQNAEQRVIAPPLIAEQLVGLQVSIQIAYRCAGSSGLAVRADMRTRPGLVALATLAAFLAVAQGDDGQCGMPPETGGVETATNTRARPRSKRHAACMPPNTLASVPAA